MACYICSGFFRPLRYVFATVSTGAASVQSGVRLGRQAGKEWVFDPTPFHTECKVKPRPITKMFPFWKKLVENQKLKDSDAH